MQQQKDKGSAPYANKKIASADAEPLIISLQQLMAQQQVFLDANLAMPKLAKMLSCSTPTLSQLLNDNLQLSFNDYVNGYRVDYAKALLHGHAAMKMDELAVRCGFNALSIFYAAFKRHAQMTPAKYRANCVPRTPEL